MKAPSEDIKDILVASNQLSLVFGTNLFIGWEPADPNDVVTIYDTPGRAPQLTFDRDEQYFYPSVQVRVRNDDYLTGWNLINDVKTVLHGIAQQVWNGTLYSLVQCSIEPAMLDWDENNRIRFVTTFDIQRRTN